MLFKADYLAGHPSAVSKDEFRRLNSSAEKLMERAPISAASDFARQYLAAGAPRAWRTARRNNFLRLLRGIEGWDEARPLFSKAAPEQSPMGFGLVFASHAARDSHRLWLERHNVYCPIHWAATARSKADVRDLAARILTIPCDHRYTSRDMDRVVKVLQTLKTI
jgi:hypothetical protein